MNEDYFIKGRYTKFDPEPPGRVSWRFAPLKKGGKVAWSDVVKELFDQGYGGGFYFALVRIPDEFPADAPEIVDLYECEDAAKIAAELSRYTLYDQKGNKL